MSKLKNTTCKFFNGSYHNTHCEAGVCYRDVTPDPDGPGCALRLPCRTQNLFDHPSPTQAEEFAKRGTCEKFQLPTDEEVAADEAAWEETHQKVMARMTKVGPLIRQIKADNKGKSNGGVAVCPCCGKNLHWSIASVNGHVHMSCETDDCIRFME